MKRVVFLLAGLALSLSVRATIYKLPVNGQNVVGQVQYFTAEKGETLSDIGMAFDVGRDAMVTANPPFKAAQPLPAGVPVVVPSKFVLPPFFHKGIVVDLSAMRLYYYPPGQAVVMTYPIGIGKPGHMTPLGATYVTHTQKDPAWTPPKSIRDYNKKRGIILPRTIRGGPDNPLGRRAIYLGIPQYLIHATNFPQSIGSRGSFGCMRMMEKNIEQLFPYVAKRTFVRIVEQPYLAGWANGKLYLEIHTPLNENKYSPNKLLKPVMHELAQLAMKHHVKINWSNVNLAFATANGIPTVISDAKDSPTTIQLAEPQLKWPKNTTLCKMSHHCSE